MLKNEFNLVDGFHDCNVTIANQLPATEVLDHIYYLYS